MKQTVLTAKNLKKTFGKGHTLVKAVDNVSLEVYKEEILLIIGPSGSGKTTLISMLGGLLRPSFGTIDFEGKNIAKLSENQLTYYRLNNVGFIFQSFNLFSSLNVLENVITPLLIKGISKADAEQEARSILKRLKLDKRINHLPKNLSGGEKQRVAIARALINNPEIILADEPTANLDSGNGEEVMNLLKEIAFEQGKSVVIVSHDQRIQEIATRKIKFENGKIRF